MLPENRIPNAMGLDARGSASMMGGMGEVVSSAYPTPEESPAPAEESLQVVADKFRGAWKQLEDLNGKHGGDSDKFRQVQVALESWFADIATKLPEQSASSQTPTY